MFNNKKENMQRKQASQSWRLRRNVSGPLLLLLLLWLALIDSWLVSPVEAGVIMKRETITSTSTSASTADPDIVHSPSTGAVVRVPTEMAKTTTITTTTTPAAIATPLAATQTMATINTTPTTTTTATTEATELTAVTSESVKFSNESEKLSTKVNDNLLLSPHVDKNEATIRQQAADEQQQQQQVLATSAIPATVVHSAIATTISAPHNNPTTVANSLAVVERVAISQVSDSDDVAPSKTSNSTPATHGATLETMTTTMTTMTTVPVARNADYARGIRTEEDGGDGSSRAAMMLHALIMSTTARNAQSNALPVQQEESIRDEQPNQWAATATTTMSTTSSLTDTMSEDNDAKHSHENSIDDVHNDGNGDNGVGVEGEKSSQGKRQKLIADNSTMHHNAQQMNLPNRVEVWSLAGMKLLVPTQKTTNASELGNEIEQLARSDAYARPLAAGGNQQLAAQLKSIAETAGATEAISMSAQLNEIKGELRSTAKLAKPNEPNEPNELLAMRNTFPLNDKTTNANVGLLSADKKDNSAVAVTATTIAPTTTTSTTNNNNSNKNAEQLIPLSVTSTTPSPEAITTIPTTTTITIAKIINKAPEQNQIQLGENEQRTETSSNKQKTAVPAAAAAAAPAAASTELPLQLAASSANTTKSTVTEAATTATTTPPRATTTTIQANENKETNLAFDSSTVAASQVQNTNAQRRKVDNVDADADVDANVAVTNRAIIELTSSTITTRVSMLTASNASTTNEERVTATTKLTKTTETIKTTTPPPPPTVIEKSDSNLENKTKPEEEKAKDLTTLPIIVGTAPTITTTTETVQISNEVNLKARVKTKILQNTHTNEANDDDDDVVHDHNDETLKNDAKFVVIGTKSDDASPNDLVNVTPIRTNNSEEVITQAAPTTTTTTSSSTTTEATLVSIKSTHLLESTTIAALATTTQAPVVNAITDVRLAGQQQQNPTNAKAEAEQQESLLQTNNLGETLQKQQRQQQQKELQQQQQQQVNTNTLPTATLTRDEITTETTTNVLLPITITTTTTTIPITIQIKNTKEAENETEANVSKNVHEAQQNKLPEVDGGDTSDSVYDEDDDMLLPKITTTPAVSTNMANMEGDLIHQNITTSTTSTTSTTTTTTPAPIINLLDDSTTTTTTTTTTAITTRGEATATATTKTTTTPKSIATKIEEIYKIVTTSTSATKTATELKIDTVAEVVTMLPKLSVPTTMGSSSSDSDSTSPTTVSPTLQMENIGGAHNPPTIMDMDNLQTKSTNNTGNGTDVNVIIAITVSVIGVVALILLVAFLYLMRKREKQKCRPVPNLDAYSLDNVSILGGSVRRKNFLRVSKRSYGNAAFDDPALRHNVLSAMELGKYVERKSSIFEEFRDVPQIIARADEVPVGCEDRNRYANVIPLPETRVMLQQLNNDDKTEYINANYVRGPKDAPNYYIACQAPLESTVCDFWRMIWEQQSRVIIQATDLSENGIEKCAEYLPPSVTLDNHTTYGDFQVTLKNREVKDKYAISTLLLKHTVEKASRELTHYWYKWPEAGVPSEEAPIIAMLLEARSSLKSYAIEQANELKEKSSTLTLKSVESNSSASDDVQPSVHGQAAAQKEAESNGNVSKEKLKAAARNQGPLTIHCSPGTGRTGTIIACDMAVRSLETPKRSVDIPQIVYHVRRGRASAVQTKEQYEFIYKVANMYATKITNLSNDN